jgi:uncharacterized protein (DUF433 family)
MTSVVSDDDIRSGSPRIEGTRITVLDIKRRVVDNDEDPHVVAGEYAVSVGDVFHALAHYYDHREEFQSRERDAERRRRDGERRTRERLGLADEGIESAEEAD